MSDPTFRARVRAYYEGRELPPERLGRLRELVMTSRSRASRWRIAAIASAAAAVVTVALVLLLSGRGEPPTVALAREIARDHQKNLDPEIRGTDYDEVGTRLPRLGFPLVAPRAPLGDGLQLAGARYCSLRGCTAAQIRLVRRDGRPCTLYEVRDVTDFGDIGQGHFELDGVSVDIWRQDGLLLGLAVTTEP